MNMDGTKRRLKAYEWKQPRAVPGDGCVARRMREGLAVGRKYASYETIVPWTVIRAALRWHDAQKRRRP